MKSLTILRNDTARVAAALGESFKAELDKSLAEIDAGIVRLYAAGPSGLDHYQATLLVKIIDADSAESEIDRAEADNDLFGTVKESHKSNVALSIGQAIRLSLTADPPGGPRPGGVPARGMAYAVELQDSRVLLIIASGPAVSPTFEKMIDDAVATLSPGCPMRT